MKFSIAHATARPHGWLKTYDEAYNRAVTPEGVEYVLSYDPRFGDFSHAYTVADWDADYPSKVVALDPSERKCAVPNWINAINHTTGDVILVNSDDFSFPDRWDESLAAVICDRDPQTQPFVIHVSTGGSRDDTLMTIQIFSRGLIKHWGYALWPEYESLYVDDDYSDHAFTDPEVEVIPARHLLFEHLHFSFGKSQNDEVYAHENRPEAANLGAEIFYRRRANNYL